MGVGASLYMYDVVVKKFTFAISSPDEILLRFLDLSYLFAPFRGLHLWLYVSYAAFLVGVTF